MGRGQLMKPYEFTMVNLHWAELYMTLACPKIQYQKYDADFCQTRNQAFIDASGVPFPTTLYTSHETYVEHS